MTSSARRLTDGQRRAMRVLCALARTALDVCDMIAERGEESDDRPRMWILTFERWTRSEESGAMLAARTRALNAWGGSFACSETVGESARMTFYLALSWLVDARADIMENPGHKYRIERVQRGLAHVVVVLFGDEPDAAVERVTRTFNARMMAVEGEWVTTKRSAATQTKTDKAAAECATGTLQGVM